MMPVDLHSRTSWATDMESDMITGLSLVCIEMVVGCVPRYHAVPVGEVADTTSMKDGESNQALSSPHASSRLVCSSI
jgi:hypothetical protein